MAVTKSVRTFYIFIKFQEPVFLFLKSCCAFFFLVPFLKFIENLVFLQKISSSNRKEMQI